MMDLDVVAVKIFDAVVTAQNHSGCGVFDVPVKHCCVITLNKLFTPRVQYTLVSVSK